VLKSFWVHRHLGLRLLKREVQERYHGSYLGILWAFTTPLLSLLVFTFVFSVIFKSRWGGDIGEDKASFALILFVGLAVFNFFAETLNRAPTIIVARANYVKRVVFPLELLPTVAVGSAAFNLVVALAILILAQILLRHTLPWTVLLLPLALLPLMFLSLGLSWFLSSLGVYVRDVGHVITPVTQMLMFLSPVFYPLEAVPHWLQGWMYLNPLTVVIEQARDLIILGRVPEWTALGGYLAAAVAVAWAGWLWFERTRKGFADVL
jgi:lipopolysaccharide transport system permease protein